LPRAANRNDPGAGSTQKISAYILAYNAAKKIKAAVETVLWADEIVVVAIPTAPSILPKASVRAWCRCRSTTSATCAIARSKPAGTNGFSASIPTSVVPKRRDEILSLLSDSPSHDAYRMPRRNHMMGRRIRGSGWYANFRQPQLFRKGAMRYTLEPVHEGYELLSDKPLGMLRNAIWQFPFRDLEEVIPQDGPLFVARGTEARAQARLHGERVLSCGPGRS
jgi:hypothetical protein